MGGFDQEEARRRNNYHNDHEKSVNYRSDIELAIAHIVDRTADGEPLWWGYSWDVRVPRLMQQDLESLRRLSEHFLTALAYQTCCAWVDDLWRGVYHTCFAKEIAQELRRRYPERGVEEPESMYGLMRMRPEIAKFNWDLKKRRAHNKALRRKMEVR